MVTHTRNWLLRKAQVISFGVSYDAVYDGARLPTKHRLKTQT